MGKYCSSWAITVLLSVATYVLDVSLFSFTTISSFAAALSSRILHCTNLQIIECINSCLFICHWLLRAAQLTSLIQIVHSKLSPHVLHSQPSPKSLAGSQPNLACSSHTLATFCNTAVSQSSAKASLILVLVFLFFVSCAVLRSDGQSMEWIWKPFWKSSCI